MEGRPAADKRRCGAEGSSRESNETPDVGETNVFSKMLRKEKEMKEKLCFS